MTCKLINVCQYETNKLVRIKSVRLGSLKWTLNGVILLFISIMMLWNKEYQQYDFVVSSVTTKVKGVALTNLPGVGNIIWDVVDYSGLSQGKNSFFVMTNVVITNDQKQGKCPEVPPYGELCRTDKDCEKGLSDQHSHGVQTGACVKFDVTRKTCEVFAWCPIETKPKPPRPALLASAENFTVLIKNDIRFPAFNYIRRNILPWMDSTYLKGCRFNKYRDRLCPIFRLGDIIQEAKENFSQMAIEGGVIGIQINWDCNLDGFSQNCLPKYTFRRLDEKESNRTLYPGLNFRFARYHRENGLEVRTLYKAFGIRFDVMVFGKAGKFNIIQLIIYIGSTLSYYALTTIIIDWLIGTSCYSREARQDYSEKKVESVRDRQQCILCVSFVDDDHIRVVKRSQKKSLQDVKPISIHQSQEDEIHLRAMVGTLQCGPSLVKPPQQEPPRPGCPSWCLCGYCGSSSLPAEQLCCRRTRGRCITTSPLFEQLVLGEALLEAVLLYREPLCERGPEDKTTALRHCAYRQYITWRYVCYIQKGYQDTDSVISSVTTKVKGYAFTNSSDLGPHIWDVADFVIPPQGENSFFVLTNAIITQRQTQSSCPEIPTASTICIDDCDCTEGFSDPRGSGIQTGLCVNYSETIKTCEVLSWCPLELDVNPPEQALLGTAENFTVLIKNSVTYPKFNFHRRNIMSDIVNASYLKRCEFSRKTDPHCPIFRLKTMVSEAEEDFQAMAVKGGVLGILIDWTCDLDWWGKPCHPQYTFRRLDNKNPVNNVAPGYNFRFAKYFNNSDGNETRTLIKGYGIRFDVIVFGNAGKFSIVPTIVNLGAALSFLSLIGAVCDWVLLTCTKRRHYYQKHKTIVLDDSDDATSESLSMGTTYGTH